MENLNKAVDRAYLMSERNPLCQVKIAVSKLHTDDWHGLLDLLTTAQIIRPTFGDDPLIKEIVLYPPKHVVDNVRWAERVAKYCNAKNIPALVVRT